MTRPLPQQTTPDPKEDPRGFAEGVIRQAQAVAVREKTAWLRDENKRLIEAISDAYCALTRDSDFGPETTEAAVESARSILGQEMVRTHAV